MTALYQTASRVWLTAAGLSLLLPASRRIGIWLPLHLALAGAISTAISGAMQTFMLALTATPAPPGWLVLTQLVLVTAGAGLIAIGMPTSTPWLTATGGAAFVAAMAILAWMLWRAWSKALNRRHASPMAGYAAAVAFVLVGGTLGALMGARGVGGDLYLHLRHAHVSLNLLGWGSITVVATMLTLLPTALRVRMPQRRGKVVLVLLTAGLLLQLVGWDAALTPVLAAGGIAYAAGALGLVALVVSVLRVERRWSVPLAALHMIAGVGWFVAGSVGLAWALLDGPSGFDAYRPLLLTAFVGGWLVQVLLGAWSYLLPMGRAGHPLERRRSLAAFEVAAPVQVLLLNSGLVLIAGRGGGWLAPGLGELGVVLAFTGAGLALVKAWAFPLLARGPVETERARAVWGG